ncbi:MAG: site-2 protease family protein [Fimbriimonas ginsengisoli]|uniref:Zinc metalloprotease n=1 Tax=Fimbriimonas ginsengisoli TaxID=1005039 RepID=A0A931PUE5_FIMGI|nr:site-2 protease family protein [Fimbriimonas ginsengisoli]MBI3722262.1 site-2 protease family protein [Fimbriimonas ginsengisoli]
MIESSVPSDMARPTRTVESHWALRVATVAGIPIRLHFTFILFLVWIVAAGRDSGALGSVLLVPAIFLCVLLHELGHALVARHFGITIRDITLYPLGGIATLQGRRPRAREEFWIALAGPAVNVVIAGLIAGSLVLLHGPPKLSYGAFGQQGLWEDLLVANLILPTFNMIPAFPMDGGRVLRAVLAMSLPIDQATRIAAGVGQVLAMGMGLAGLLTGNVILLLIALFVFIGAGQEVSATGALSLIEGRTVSEAMLTHFERLESGQTLQRASEKLLEGSQQDFPVMIGEEVLGVLTRSSLIQGLAQEGPTAYVSGHMLREFRRATPADPLEDTLEHLASADGSPILVMEGDSLVGMLTRDNLSEFLMLEAIRHRRGLQKS